MIKNIYEENTMSQVKCPLKLKKNITEKDQYDVEVLLKGNLKPYSIAKRKKQSIQLIER